MSLSWHALAAAASSNSTHAVPLDFPLLFSAKKVTSRTLPYSEQYVSTSTSVVHHVRPLTYTAVGASAAGASAAGAERAGASA